MSERDLTDEQLAELMQGKLVDILGHPVVTPPPQLTICLVEEIRRRRIEHAALTTEVERLQKIEAGVETLKCHWEMQVLGCNAFGKPEVAAAYQGCAKELEKLQHPAPI